MVNESVLLRKFSIIRDSLCKLRKYSSMSLDVFLKNVEIQDVVIHNLFLAIQASIDLGAHIIADEGWGIPAVQTDIFFKLKDKKVLDDDLAEELVHAVGLRNIVVHEYKDVDLSIIHHVLSSKTDVFEKYIKCVSSYFHLI